MTPGIISSQQIANLTHGQVTIENPPYTEITLRVPDQWEKKKPAGSDSRMSSLIPNTLQSTEPTAARSMNKRDISQISPRRLEEGEPSFLDEGDAIRSKQPYARFCFKPAFPYGYGQTLVPYEDSKVYSIAELNRLVGMKSKTQS